MNILVCYVTAGAGHRRSAEAIAEAAKEHFPGAEVRCVDFLGYTPSWFRRFYSWSYLLLVRHFSWVWRFSYALLDHSLIYRLIQPLRRAWNLNITRSFVALLRLQRPDVIVATHFLPADVCSALKRSGLCRSALVVIVTDLHPHRFWISGEPEAIVVATAESARTLKEREGPIERTHVLGIPIGRSFGLSPDREALRARFELQRDRGTVLVTSGGTTVGHFETVVQSLLSLEEALPGRVQLLVVCGEDRGAKRRLLRRAQTASMPMRVFGFVDYMAELMASSDIVVAKAGGLTLSESLGLGIPVILYHVIPGQERFNAQYVVERGAALIAQHPAQVAAALRSLIENPDALSRMRQAAKALGHPDAAEAIVSEVIAPLLQSAPSRS